MEKIDAIPECKRVIQEKKERLLQVIQEQKIKIIENAPMSRYTSFKAGGCAELLVIVENELQLKTVLQAVAEENIPSMLLGNGSNTLFRDTGYTGVVIKLGEGFEKIDKKGEIICAGAAALLSAVAREALRSDLTGMEFASGIPGSLGGAVFMNAGAYGGEMRDILRSVKVISKDGLHERVLSVEELELAYRHSVLEETGDIVVSAEIELKKGDHDEIAAQMKALADKRNSKQPVNYPSAGSTFKRPDGYFAGKLVEDAGLKGISVGGAQVSVLHSGFIINTGKATATDILDLITLVQNTVYDKYGVSLAPEVRFIGSL